MKNERPGRKGLEQRVVVGGEDDGRTLVVDVAEQAEKLGGKIGVEVPGGLVGENQPRLIDQCPGDGDPLLLAAGEGLGIGRLPVMESESLEHVVGPAMGLAGRDPMEPKDEGDVLENRLSTEQLEVLENHPDFPPQLGQRGTGKRVDPAAGDPDLTRGRPLGGIEHPQQRRLADTGRSGQKDHLPGIDRKIDPTEDLPSIVVLGEAADPDHGAAGFPSTERGSGRENGRRSGEERALRTPGARNSRCLCETTAIDGITLPPGSALYHWGEVETALERTAPSPWEIRTVGRDRALVRVFDSASMAFALGPARGAAKEPSRLEAIIDDQITALRYCHQVHGRTIHRIGTDVRPVAETGSGDGLITTDPGVGLLIWTADCVPVLVAAEGCVAAVHAGWRGCAADVVGAAVESLGYEHGCTPDRLRVALGPAVCGACYEVGPEVTEALRRFDLDESRWLNENRVDLRGFLSTRLEALGVLSEHIETVGPCTVESADLASYRRDGAAAGRQWAMIVLNG
jgi:YfiH family protein